MESDSSATQARGRDEMNFHILRESLKGVARLGRLVIPGRKVLETPGYVGITSRGVIPHLSQDNFQSKTAISGVYLGLEDFLERAQDKVPLYQYSSSDGSTTLRSFCALPSDTLLMLGPRRTQPVTNLRPNTAQSITVWTAFGARDLAISEYVEAVAALKPDIAIGPADVLHDGVKPSKVRLSKMSDRSESWVRLLGKKLRETGPRSTAVFLPILPISGERQRLYLEALEEQAGDAVVQGVAVYDMESTLLIPPALSSLPRLALTEPEGASDILAGIALGVDLFTIPFVSTATDASIALTFSFPPTEPAPTMIGTRPLGIDLRDNALNADVAPIMQGCDCYACKHHHRAYLHHLFAAKEMLAWVLLQIHNHHVVDNFFAGVRQSLVDATFERDKDAFESTYETSLPAASGQGPRARGYQFKSEGLGEAKKNPKAYNAFDDGDVEVTQDTAEETLLHPAAVL